MYQFGTRSIFSSVVKGKSIKNGVKIIAVDSKTCHFCDGKLPLCVHKEFVNTWVLPKPELRNGE